MRIRVEYSPSSRATCRGPKPCFGTKINKDSLRLGEPTENQYDPDGGTAYRWRHWGCTKPAILSQIKQSGGVRSISGFSDLSAEDQAKVTTAVQRGYVDPADIPTSAKAFDYTGLPTLPEAPRDGTGNATIQATQSTSEKRKRVDNTSRSQSMTLPSGSRLSTSRLKGPIIELTDSDSDSDPDPDSEDGRETKRRKMEPSGIGSQMTGTAPSSSQTPTVIGTIDLNDTEDEDNEEDSTQDEVYVNLDTNVVGIKHYSGLVGAGEQVNLVREPTNQWDRHAIQVLNISGRQVGHLPKNVVARLSPLIDRRQITVEGTMTSGNLGSAGRSLWTLNINVAIIGPTDPERKKALEPYLTWATPGQRGFNAMRSQTGVAGIGSPKKGQSNAAAAPGPSRAIESAKASQLRSILESVTRLDDTTRRDNLLNSLCGEDVLELPVMPNPPSVASGHLKTELLKHQKQALLWCTNAENPKLPQKEADRAVQFWQIKSTGGKRYYFNLATKTPQSSAPELGRGGIIGDDMGLGKTLTVLSLIVATRNQAPSSGYSNGTLIVAPLSVLSNWSSQIEEHLTTKCKIKVHVYYGEGRNVSTSTLRLQDIVITTYQTLAADLPPSGDVTKAKSGLFAVRWKRCVLDEGHTIRNPKTKTAQACYALDAERRWIVSGTPIINNPSDLGSLLRFLRICKPLDDPEYFKRLLSRPLGRQDLEAVELLKALMSSCCLRRTKEMQDKKGNALVPLPPVSINVVRVQLDDKTREFYDSVERVSRRLVQQLVSNGRDRNQAPMEANVLSMLTRLRQIALDPRLVPENYLEELRAASKSEDARPQQQIVEVTPKEKRRLQNMLAQAIKDNEECPICFDVMTNPRITTCAHRFCLLCILEIINRQAMCPLDRGKLTQEHLLEPAPEEEEVESDEDSTEDAPRGDDAEVWSAKVSQLIELLKVQPWDSKSLVFSQFTSYLDLIAVALKKAKIPFVRFDGSMSAKKRQVVLETFSEPLSREEDFDEDETEPESGDERYDAYQRWKKGKGKANARTVARFLERGNIPNPVVMLISLKSGALGLNCTVANNVFLMDPWWQEAIESQAIDRVNRLGQKKDVFVYQMVAENTIEDKVLQIQERKRNLIKQAFSGTRTVQTQRQKKEARLQEIIELFGKKP